MDRQPTDRRVRILKVAERLFAEQGFERARVGAIAAQAEVNKALICGCFKSKEGILDRIVAPIVDEGRGLREAVLRELGGSESSGPLSEAVFNPCSTFPSCASCC